MRVIFGIPRGIGWHPVTHMVRLLAKLLEAELLEVSVTRGVVRSRQLLAVTPGEGAAPASSSRQNRVIYCSF